MASSPIAYLLSLPKLNRLIADHGTGNNALQISMEQNDAGEFQLRASFIQVALRPALPRGTNELAGN